MLWLWSIHTYLLVRRPFQETYILVVIRDLELFRLDALQLESSEISQVSESTFWLYMYIFCLPSFNYSC